MLAVFVTMECIIIGALTVYQDKLPRTKSQRARIATGMTKAEVIAAIGHPRNTRIESTGEAGRDTLGFLTTCATCRVGIPKLI
jgi:hypothetical protein